MPHLWLYGALDRKAQEFLIYNAFGSDVLLASASVQYGGNLT
jgi:hypothetical protein